jgi:endonuclease YncB( thermonuclease family)
MIVRRPIAPLGPKGGPMRGWLLFVLLALVALLLVGPWWVRVSHDEPSGQLAVIDGDTLQVGDTIVQLYGIDAPELGQLCYADGEPRPCGVEAALALHKLIAMEGPALHCKPWQGDDEGAAPPGTRIEVCEVGSEDVSLVMLLGGHSVALPQSFPDYVEAQERAREGRLGIWHTTFEPPWKWRQGERQPSEQVDCNVRGVIDSQGLRIYHVPTDPDYNDVAVDPARGDASFCSDEDARQAGWRRPSRSTG